jgi:hypothetical protein
MTTDFTHDVFLSYNHADQQVVLRLAERLRKAGLKIWMDVLVVKPGDIIPLKASEGLEQSKVLVMCISAAALASGWVALESSTVIHRDPANKERRFVPLLLSDCKLPNSLRPYKYIDYREETDTAFAQLLAACTEDEKRTTISTIQERPQPLPSKKGSKTRSLTLGGITIITLVATIILIATMVGPCKKDRPNHTVTVFVHGKKSKHDLVIRQEGHVLMDVRGGERKKELIDDKGAASFKNVQPGDTVTMDVDFREPYKATHPDALYVIPPDGDGRLYLEVELKGLDLLSGEIVDREGQPIAGANIQVLGEQALTDSAGYFFLKMPADKVQQQAYPMVISKEGYIPKPETYRPGSNAIRLALEKTKKPR